MNYQQLDLIILKHILSHKNHALQFLNDGDEKLFHHDIWRFSKLILDYIKTYKEIPTRKIISEQNQKNESLVKYINIIFDDIEKIQIDIREFKYDLEKIKNRYTEKLIYQLKDKLIDGNGNIDIKKSISEINCVFSNIKAINAPKAYEQKTLKESISDIRNRYVAKQKDPSVGSGLKTGIDFFDKLTDGIRPSECLMIAGPTAGGKSILLSQIAKKIWLGDNNIDMESDFKPGNDVIFFSLEMPMDQCLERLCANLASVPQVGIRDAQLDNDQKQRMSKALKFIEKYPNELTIVDAPRGLTPEGMELIYNNIVEEKGKKPAAVVIDYLALMDYKEEGLDDWLKQGKLAEAVSEFGRVHNINTITAVQMTDDDKNKPGSGAIGTHRLSRSRMIGHNANFIFMIEKRANEQQRPDFVLHLVKSRRSALGTGVLYKNLECCALLNEMPASLDNIPMGDIDIDENTV